MNVLMRVTNPSKHCIEPYKTIWKNEDQYFIQLSKDPESPNWLPMGDFLFKCFQKSITEDFISELLTTYESLNTESENL